MASHKFYFTGFNGFGQFETMEKIVKSFTELNLLNSERQQHLKQCIENSWNRWLHAIDNILFIRGCINENKNAMKQIPFEHAIKAIAQTDQFCLVLLSTGILYKINLITFDVNELNTMLIQKIDEEKLIETKKSIFGHTSISHENMINELNDEYFTHIASGRSFTIAITNKNAVYNLPMKIFTFPLHVRIKKISCGNEHCLILTTNGDLYAFGSSSRGQLGIGTINSVEEPVLIEALAGIKIIDADAGGWHSAAVSAFNDLYVFGWNVNGQCGQPIYETYESINKNGKKFIEKQKLATVFPSPLIVDLPKNNNLSDNDDFDSHYNVIGVAAGARHTVIKTDDGILLGAGWNKYGQLAMDNLDGDFDKFQVIDTNCINSKDFSIICGEWSTILLCS